MEDRYLVSAMVTKLSPYVPGPLHWYAKQDSGPDDWCIAIGKGAACFTMDEHARSMSDDFIRELATQILGYSPDSLPDLERKMEEAKDQIKKAQEDIDNAMQRRTNWTHELTRLELQWGKAAEQA